MMDSGKSSHLTSITIEDFKGVPFASVEPSRINILVGPNNSGKSSFLEAILLVLTQIGQQTVSLSETGGRSFPHRSHRSIKRRRIWGEHTSNGRVIDYLLKTKGYNPLYFVRANADEGAVSLTFPDNTEWRLMTHRSKLGQAEDYNLASLYDILSMEISQQLLTRSKTIRTIVHRAGRFIRKRIERKLADRFSLIRDGKTIGPFLKELREILFEEESPLFDMYDSIAEDEELEREISGIYEHAEQLIEVLDETPKLILDISRDEKPFSIGYLMDGFSIEMQQGDGLELPNYYNYQYRTSKSSIDYFFDPRTISDLEFIEHYHDIIVKEGLFDQVVHLLRERIEYIDDIHKIDEGLVVEFQRKQYPLPLCQMGSGFLSLLKMSMILAMVGEGLILLEEPEMSLHPGYTDILAEVIIDGSKANQFFLTTHSADFVDSILAIAREKGVSEDVRVIRFLRKEDVGTIETEVLSGTEALDEIETIGTDLRGV